LAVDADAEVAAVRAALDAAGFPRLDEAAGAEGEWRHAGADPGRPVRVRGCGVGSAAWRAALLRRDWLRADAAARAERIRSAMLPGADGEAERRRWEES